MEKVNRDIAAMKNDIPKVSDEEVELFLQPLLANGIIEQEEQQRLCGQVSPAARVGLHLWSAGDEDE